MFGNNFEGFEDVYDDAGLTMVGDEFDGIMPDIEAGDFDENYVDPTVYEAPQGRAMPGPAAAATAVAPRSTPNFGNATRTQGPQLGAAFPSKDGGFWLSLGVDSIMTLIEACNRALEEVQAMAERGAQPAKFATAISLNLVPNANYRPGAQRPGPLGFIYLGSRGAMKEEASAQRPVAAVGDPSLQKAMGIISQGAPLLELPPRAAHATTTAAAATAVAAPVVQNDGCLINLK